MDLRSYHFNQYGQSNFLHLCSHFITLESRSNPTQIQDSVFNFGNVNLGLALGKGILSQGGSFQLFSLPQKLPLVLGFILECAHEVGPKEGCSVHFSNVVLNVDPILCYVCEFMTRTQIFSSFLPGNPWRTKGAPFKKRNAEPPPGNWKIEIHNFIC